MKRRLCSAFAAVLLLIGVMAGCSNVTYVARVNGTEVPLRYYTVNMLLTKIQLETAYGDSYKDYMQQENGTNPEKTNAEVLDEAAKKTFERLYLNLLKVTEMGLPANEVQLEFYKAEYEYFRSIFASNADFDLFLREAGVSEEELQEVYLINTVYPDLIKNYFYDKDVGIEAYARLFRRERAVCYQAYSVPGCDRGRGRQSALRERDCGQRRCGKAGGGGNPG